jgi:hypothetical protein
MFFLNDRAEFSTSSIFEKNKKKIILKKTYNIFFKKSKSWRKKTNM